MRTTSSRRPTIRRGRSLPNTNLHPPSLADRLQRHLRHSHGRRPYEGFLRAGGPNEQKTPWSGRDFSHVGAEDRNTEAMGLFDDDWKSQVVENGKFQQSMFNETSWYHQRITVEVF